MNKIHMWSRIAYLGLVVVKCGRKVRATQFTDRVAKVTCQACLNKMDQNDCLDRVKELNS